MKKEDDEDSRLRSIALQTANSIQHARQRAEEELIRAKEALERKTNELAHSLAMVRATLESTTDAILATDDSRKVTNRNHQYLAMWRIPPESQDEQDHRQLLKVVARQFSDPSQFLARVEDIYASSAPESYDLLELADGRVIERFSRIQFVDERNVGRVWTFRDITERRGAEEARLHLSAVVDSTDDAIVSKDLDGVIRSWNQAATRIFGYTPEEVIGKSITLLLPAERLHEEEEILRRLRRGQRVDHFETVRVHKDGRLIDVSVTISPIRSPSGQIVGASKIARDITERKRAEQQKAELVERLAKLMSNTPLAVVEWDADFVVTRWSGQAEQLFGWTAAEVVGRRIDAFPIVYEDDKSQVEATMARLPDPTKTFVVSHNRNNTKSGKVLSCEWYNSVLHDDAGRVVAILSLALDVTERKRTEADAGNQRTPVACFDAGHAPARLGMRRGWPVHFSGSAMGSRYGSIGRGRP